MPIAAVLLAWAPAAALPSVPRECASGEPGAILVCGTAPQPYRIDPDVAAGQQATERDQASASAPVPAAQAACARSPSGCSKGLDSLDLANVALVAGTMAVKAARGEDWAKPLRPAGPGEYRRYQEAREQRRERAADQAARRLRDAARAAAEQ